MISLDNKTLSLLKKWRIKQNEMILRGELVSSDHHLIFTRENGSPLRLAYPNEKLDIVIKKHHLHRITIHGLRHTHPCISFI